MNREQVLKLMKKKWDTPEKIAALRVKYGWTVSYMSYMFSGKKPPSVHILTELKLKREREIIYVPLN